MNTPLEAAIEAVADRYVLLDCDPNDPCAAVACLRAFIEHPELGISDKCRKTMLAQLEDGEPITTTKIPGW